MGARSIPPPPRPVRRALHVLWPGVATLVTALMVPVIIAGAFHAFVDRRARLFRVSCLAVLLLWVDVRMLLRCWTLWARSPDASSPTWYQDHEQLLRDALDSLMYYTRRWLGLEVVLDDRMHFGSPDQPLIAFARHAGPFDSITVAWLLAHTAGRLPRIVLAEAMRWDPAIDTILTRLDSFFVPADDGADRLAGVASMASTLGADDVFLLFPEGQNWTPCRRRRLIARLRQRGEHGRAARAERLVNVLPPKSRGAWAARSSRPGADIMVIAHAGYGHLSTHRMVWEALPFTGRPFLVRTWTFAAHDVPTDADTFAGWLDARWSEVDAWVSSHTAAEEPRHAGEPSRSPHGTAA